MAYTGAQLKKIREERNIPLEAVASATHIRLAILQDLEDEEYSELSSTTQTKGFLKLYADYLALSEQLTIVEDEEESKLNQNLSNSVKDEQKSEQDEKSGFENEALSQDSEKSEKTVKKEYVIPLVKKVVRKENTENDAEEKLENLTESSEELMAIGRELAARRRYLNVGWEVIESETHIPKDQLKSIERGDLAAFVNPMQFKGHLQAYARFLNLDVEAVMIRYADAIQKRRLEKVSQEPIRKRIAKVLPPFLLNLKRFFTLDLFFGSLMILGILGFLIWGISRMTFGEEEPELTGTLPAVADILLGEGTPTAIVAEETLELEEETVQLIPTSTPFYVPSENDSNLELVLLIRQNIWLKIISDGDVLFQGRQVAGNVLTYLGEDEIELETGNIAAIEIIFNQRTFDKITDTLGRPARLLFTSDGVAELPIIYSTDTAQE